MNVENVLKVADAIEKNSIPDLGFAMDDWLSSEDKDYQGRHCGTIACVAGHAFVIATGKRHNEIDVDGTVGEVARKYLGLDWDLGDALFCPRTIDIEDWATIKPDQAVRTLRHLAATGIVDWDLPEPSAA